MEALFSAVRMIRIIPWTSASEGAALRLYYRVDLPVPVAEGGKDDLSKSKKRKLLPERTESGLESEFGAKLAGTKAFSSSP